MKWRGIVNSIIGLWLITAVFAGFSFIFYNLNNIIIGLIIIGVNFFFDKVKPWQIWLGSIVGVWLIISAFVQNLISGAGFYLNGFLTGLTIIYVGISILIYPEKFTYEEHLDKHKNYGDYGAE